jgi:protease IV
MTVSPDSFGGFPNQPNMSSSPAPYPTPNMQTSTPQTIVVQSRESAFTRWFSWVGWMGLLLCIPIITGMAAKYRDYFDRSEGISEKFFSGSETSQDKIAVIDISGTILDGASFVKHQIDRVRKDENVKSIVVRVNSPGGTVTGSDYIYHHLQNLRKDREIPMVVSMGSLAASGGYYVSMAVGDEKDVIFAEPTTTTGSIGVIIPHYDLTGLMDRMDIRDDSIVSHPRKQLLSMTKKPSDEDRAVLQKYVDESFNRFKEIVKSGRPAFREHPERLDVLATGEIFNAESALEYGLVDRLGFIEDAIARAAELAKLDPTQVRVVEYQPPVTILDALAAQQSRMRSQEELMSLFVPRAYYLFTAFPVIVDSRP